MALRNLGWNMTVAQAKERAPFFWFEVNLDERSAGRQDRQVRVLSLVAWFPAPCEDNTPLRHDFLVLATRNVASVEFNAQQAADSRFERVGITDPARHQGGIDQDGEDGLWRRRDENLALNDNALVAQCFTPRSAASASRFSCLRLMSQNSPSSARSRAIALRLAR